jgi:hypothetical protein
MKITRLSGNTISIESVIHTVRGEKVILDADLARIYGVTTKRAERAGQAECPSVSRGLRISSEHRQDLYDSQTFLHRRL